MSRGGCTQKRPYFGESIRAAIIWSLAENVCMDTKGSVEEERRRPWLMLSWHDGHVSGPRQDVAARKRRGCCCIGEIAQQRYNDGVNHCRRKFSTIISVFCNWVCIVTVKKCIFSRAHTHTHARARTPTLHTHTYARVQILMHARIHTILFQRERERDRSNDYTAAVYKLIGDFSIQFNFSICMWTPGHLNPDTLRCITRGL